MLDIKNTIINSKFTEKQKARLSAILPMLGVNLSSCLKQVVDDTDNLSIEDYITTLWENFAIYFSGFKNNDEKIILRFWTEFDKIQTPFQNLEDKRYWLSLVLDIRALFLAKTITLPDDKNNRLEDFELELFELLPKKSILWWLQNGLGKMNSHFNPLRMLETISFDREWYNESSFSKDFSECLLKNNETVGKLKPRTLADWIRDFLNSGSVKVAEKGNLQVSDFVVKQASNFNLQQDEKEFLLNALILFTWFLNPQIDEVRVEKYKAERQAKKYEIYQLELNKLFNNSFEEIASFQKKPEVFEPVRPAVKKVDVQEILNRGAGVRIGNQQDIINSKLEAGEQGGKKENVGNTPPSLSLSPQGRGGETLRKVPPVVPVKPQMPTNKITTSPVPTSRDTLSSKGEGKEEDLLQIREEIERKKQMAQAQIDKRLEELKKKANN